MSDDTIIRIEKLGKSYLIDHQAGKSRQASSYRRLSEELVSLAALPWHKVRHLFSRQRTNAQPSREEFWALKDVSFEVRRGDAIGIIGRNGAGKSTLLKILSRITEPTSGRVEIDGRVASLLEVGTGFHPELTGRQNVYLNGAILGMTRKEIARKFDEIIDFAEVEKFLDTPVKRYSSGMYVRLAFAVAAHLEPEILVVDEVLAVGDAAFQQRCLGKMEDVTKRGRTILFVSHNLQAMRQLCTRGVLLEDGVLRYEGLIHRAIEEYEGNLFTYEKAENQSPGVLYCCENGGRGSGIKIVRVEVLDEKRDLKREIVTGDFLVFRFHFFSDRDIASGSVVSQVFDDRHYRVFLSSTQPDFNIPMRIKPGYHHADCVIPYLPLSSGIYTLGGAIAIPGREWLFKEDYLCKFRVMPNDIYNSGLPPISSRSLMAFPHTWVIS